MQGNVAACKESGRVAGEPERLSGNPPDPPPPPCYNGRVVYACVRGGGDWPLPPGGGNLPLQPGEMAGDDLTRSVRPPSSSTITFPCRFGLRQENSPPRNVL